MGLLKKYYNFGITTHFIILLISGFLMWFFGKVLDFLITEDMYGDILDILFYIIGYALLFFLLTSLMCILSKILKNKLPIIGIIIFVICLLYFFNETSKGWDAHEVFYSGYPLYIFSIALLITSIIHLLIKRNK